MNNLNVIAVLYLIAAIVAVVMTVRAINRNINDEKLKIRFFICLFIFQLALAAFFVTTF